MSKVLEHDQREQAGSDSYNRFEYQAHWIVCHIITLLDSKPQCIVFCEYHDDVSELPCFESSSFEFYQVKTKEDNTDWTVAELSKREKNRDGFQKKTFLGFVFYNFWKFGDECTKCHFISNCDFDEDIRAWQACIEDGHVLKNENPDLYTKILQRISEEYVQEAPDDFNSIFDRFIQNTFIQKSELQLETYEAQTKGMFFESLANKKIPVNTANFIFGQILSDVRKKSKEKIKAPISKKTLVNKKGIEISKINAKLNEELGSSGNYLEFAQKLAALGISTESIPPIVQAKTMHDTRWLNIEDIHYQETVLFCRKIIAEQFETVALPDIYFIRELCYQKLVEAGLSSLSIDSSLVEVLYYEQRIRNHKAN